MNDGYVRLWRKINDNQFLAHDNNAYLVFVKLLTLVNWKTGSYDTGRFKFSEITNLNPNTLYKVLIRLEDNGLVTLTSNNRYSTITICNWKHYQADGNSTSNNPVTTREHHGNNTVTLYKELRIKNKELKKNNISPPFRDVLEIFDYYVQCFGVNGNAKLSDLRKKKIRLRLKDAGKELILKAIKNLSESPFHMGDNDRGWKADIDFIVRSYEQVEKYANMDSVNGNIPSAEEALKYV
jgi:hypothetical protein